MARPFVMLCALTLVSLYPATADAMECPAGYQKLAAAGTEFGCIETAERPAVDFFTAEDTCFAEGARVPHFHEFRTAFANLGLSTADSDSWEWLNEVKVPSSNIIVKYDPIEPLFLGLSLSTGSWPASHHYRCFIPAQGNWLAYVPTGPWWLTIALLGTGVALQWKYLRGKEAS